MNALHRADRMGLGEYEALMFEWAERHAPQGSDIEGPSPEQVRRNFAKIPAQGSA